jgi:hypothetical protein
MVSYSKQTFQTKDGKNVLFPLLFPRHSPEINGLPTHSPRHGHGHHGLKKLLAEVAAGTWVFHQCYRLEKSIQI